MDENVFFREATLRICSSLNLQRAMERTLEYISGYIPADSLQIGLFDPDLRVLRSIVRIRPDNWPDLHTTIPVPEGAMANVLRQWRSEPSFEVINDWRGREPDILPLLRMIWPEDVSLLRTDLALESRRIGILVLGVQGRNRYEEDHARLMNTLNEPFAIAVANALQYQEVVRLKEMLEDDNRYLSTELRNVAGDRIIGADLGLREVMQLVRQVGPLESPVLLLGETGTGKELLAHALHMVSPRHKGPFVKVNCGGLPESLLDSELFGHEKGAFTGALALKRGRFERAQEGTIFLDEIGELSPGAQVKLLRVLQQREIERVGGTQTISVDVRIVSATHRNLEQMVRDGTFREDLWFRLNVFPIMIPPLRHRPQDIPALLDYIVSKKCREMKIARKVRLASGTMDRLKQHGWPGNVRELQNLVERSLIHCQSIRPDSGDLILELHPSGPVSARPDSGVDQEEIVPFDLAVSRMITRTLERTDGRIIGPRGAAQLLGLHPSTLRGKMRKLNILAERRKRGN
ncbi:Transcriptional regulator containing GAF, AAA-type ATPase, and DNA-binding Fis domains [Desulfonatronum thiosulfatophilum]|uniref:Transcriptional regulator containing GAF, AAA-type ATPase, and DNA-binding Fis domains n=1 Tax=Desulfonatronum thiosulfatophilum TaxID=617002 RepID=A0A1G6ER84_9BACT|nr:sigma 54-interacting transcriptional regulator [Desulfonatronum thiosulfatophilum]SDB60059.1 Transcriptional regulator containing GAF, AAA-type ATPase, and DNA-binding Fis domains [Desulfonatronum thiosulfatophilum]